MKKNNTKRPDPTMLVEVTLKVTNAKTGETTQETFNPDRFAFVMHSDMPDGQAHMTGSLLGGVSRPSDLAEVVDGLEGIKNSIFRDHPEVKAAYGAHRMLQIIEEMLSDDDDEDDCECDCTKCEACTVCPDSDTATPGSTQPSAPTKKNIHEASEAMRDNIRNMFKGNKK